MTVGLLYGDLLFGAVLTILYAVKIVVSFTKVQYDIQNNMWWAVYMCLFQISWGMFLPRIGKIG